MKNWTGHRHSGSAALVLILALFVPASISATISALFSPPQLRAAERNAALFAELGKGPHLGSPEEAVVGIEVTNRSEDGAVEQTRHGAGFVLRCDGFVLAPASLFGRGMAVAGRSEDAARQVITVTLQPGTPQEVRTSARPPRHMPRDTGLAVVKMEGVHSPALPTLLPDTLKIGDSVQLVGIAWDAGAKRFRAYARLQAALSPITPASDSDPRPGEIGIDASMGAPAMGSVVIGPSGTAVGMVTTLNAGGKCDRFTSFSVLDRVTNCVTPLSVPPSEGGADDGGMVQVPGGPFLLPPVFAKEQPDMAGAGVACVAPFKIDKLEVSNREYLVFWLSLSETDRRRLGFQSNFFPASWSKTEAPYPASIADFPVIGVPFSGASAYAKAHGKRLPTPYEWALAAFGPRGEQDVEAARRYIADRNDVWARVKSLHIEYLQQNPQLQQEIYYSPSHYALPWMAASPAAQNAARWSKETIESLCDPLWQVWHDPLYLAAVGSRDFDVSPYGAKDMLLNASEMVQPYPGAPINGRPRYMGIEWLKREPTKKDPWTTRSLPALAEIDSLPPLSRLYRRALPSPPASELMSLSSMSETISMVAPLSGWSLNITSDSTTTIAGLIPRRPPGAVVLRLPGSDLYEARPRHFRLEMGVPVPMDRTDRSPSGGPQLYYLAPAGFRCAR